MEKISLKAWKQFSFRPYSSSYISADGQFMLKTISDKMGGSKTVEEEYQIASLATRLKIHTPRVVGLFELEDGRLAIMYEYAGNKISFSRAIAADPNLMDEYMQKFADLSHNIHSKEADTHLLPSVESKIELGLQKTAIFNEKEKDIIREKMMKIPKETKCLHGDHQMSNAIHSDKGDFLIDLGFMSYGNPLYDVGFFHNLTHFIDDDISEGLFHMSQAKAAECCELYERYYFNNENKKEIEDIIKPFSQLGCLVVLSVFDVPSVENARDFILSDL